MSLWELENMMRSIVKLEPKSKEPTDEEWEAGEALMAEATAHMKDVRL